MSRYLPLALFAGLVLTSTAAGWAKGDDTCTVATKGDSPVAKACAKGGVKEAKRTMKDMAKAAKKAGMEKVECDDCHKSPGDDDFTLKSDARDRFAQMLKLAGGAAEPK
jgi:hypothetical protein